MKIDPNEVIGSYLKEKDTVFTSEEFCSYLKDNGIKLSKNQTEDLLHASDFVFSLVNNEFITRNGVFLGRWFSFKPSKEEIEKGSFIIGHRCMPFNNPETNPDSIIVVSNDRIVKSKTEEFSMNLALDTFALYGEGYVIPYVINDKGNKNISLSSVQYSMPTKITLTSWPFEDLINGENIEYGDRILCRVIDWESSIVEMSVIKTGSTDLVVTRADIEREDWYSGFESGILESLERHGPASSIEEQLAFLFLENQEKLCIKNCGSIEEFLSHTSKIDFEPYGVETRIWRTGEYVPYVGSWNKHVGKEQIVIDLALIFTPNIIDSYIKNNIYEEKNDMESDSINDLIEKMIPKILSISPEERNAVLLNIKKRRDILCNRYNPFVDYSIAEVRKRTLTLFSKVCTLLCSIGSSEGRMVDYPQQELVILSQLFGHLVRLLEEFENEFNRDRIPVDDVSISLDGMEETFDEIDLTLESALEENKMKGFQIISDKS